VALVGAMATTAAAQVSDGTARAVIAGSTPAWATTSSQVGDANGAAVRHVQLALGLRDEAGAEALAKAVSTPGSPEFGHHLTASQFAAKYAPTDSTVAQVSSWLRSQGLSVGKVSSNKHFVDVTATNAQLGHAFGTHLARFRASIGGRTRELVAPASAVSVPVQLRGMVTAVVGLDDSTTTVHPQQMVPRPGGAGAQPAAAGQTCAHYWGEQSNPTVPTKYSGGDQSNTLCGYLTAQARAIYGLGAGNTGAGTSVGIVGAYNLASIVSDTNRAARDFGNTPLVDGQYTTVLPAGGFNDNPSCDSPEAWASEQALDVQAVHTLAPAAKITFYAGADCAQGIYTALNTAVSQNTVSVITNSWATPGENDVAPAVRDQLTSIAVQAAIQGQAILFSSGDAGDNSGIKDSNGVAQPAQPGFPASDPWVTAVGGTSVALNANNSVRFQTGWEDGGETQSGGQWTPLPADQGKFAGGSSGGVSKVYGAPDYQAGVVPASVAGGHRAVPDIAMLASAYTGLAVGFTATDAKGNSQYVEFPAGGTSLSSPLLAGMVANTEQTQHLDRFGFLNPAIYALNGGKAITDVTPHPAGVWTPGLFSFGGVPVPSQGGSYLVDFDAKPQTLQSGTGWDAVTGVGTPNAAFLTDLGQ
jgi:subtilase family serine protease